MTRIIIQSISTKLELEVDSSTYNAGFFPGYAYVRDAAGGSSSPAPIDPALKAAIDSEISATGGGGGGAALTDAAMASAYGPSTGAKVAADPLLKAAFDARYLTATVAGSADDPDITLYLNGVAL